MALFDFAKKKPPAGAVPPGAPPTPTDYVRDMRSQGYSDDQIIEALRASKYPEQAIQDALKQTAVKGPAVPGMTDTMLNTPLPTGEPSKQDFESIAEAIVEERWQEVKAALEKRTEWEDKINNDISQLKAEVADLKGDMQNLHKAIVSKISDYDKNLLSVGTEIKAMEKVFQNILPELTKNVSELSRITKSKK